MGAIRETKAGERERIKQARAKELNQTNNNSHYRRLSKIPQKVEAIPEKIRRNHPRYETEGLIQNTYMINGRGKKREVDREM